MAEAADCYCFNLNCDGDWSTDDYKACILKFAVKDELWEAAAGLPDELSKSESSEDTAKKDPRFVAQELATSQTAHVLHESISQGDELSEGKLTLLEWAIQTDLLPLATLLASRDLSLKAEWRLPAVLLSLACERGHEAIARLFLGAIDDAEKLKDRPLALAASNRHEHIVRLLLDNGASVDSTNWYGESALDLAKWKGYGNIVRLLVDHNANVNIPAGFGDTPTMDVEPSVSIQSETRFTNRLLTSRYTASHEAMERLKPGQEGNGRK